MQKWYGVGSKFIISDLYKEKAILDALHWPYFKDSVHKYFNRCEKKVGIDSWIF